MSIERPRVSVLRKTALQIVGVFVLCLLLVSASGQSSESDAAAMQQLKQSLNPPPANWADADPCKWVKVQCDRSKRVTRIQLGSQKVSGSLSPSVGNLTNLEVLELMGNNLTGPLPSLKGLSSLQTLILHDNQFSLIPKDFFDGLTSLQEVYLDNNPFSDWSMPDGLKSATSLKNFSANSANIVGAIPDFVNSKTFPSMIHLRLSSNRLQGGLPKGFSGFGLQSLWLNGQKDSKGALTLGGTIEVLQDMTQLIQVWLNMNNFTGPIPDLSGLAGLQDLNLRDNILTGPVPPSLTKMTSLKVLNLTNNALHGPTPEFSTSVAVDMVPGRNKFCLPKPGVDCDSRVNVLISVLEPFGYPYNILKDWGDNDPCLFPGIGCSGANKVKNITQINLQNKSIAGTLSPNFAALTSLETLNLAHNDITGSIPDAFTTMPNLRTLDLSYNHLDGSVPKFTNTSVNVEGNSLPGQDSSGGSSRKGSKTGKIVGAVTGSVCLLFLVGLGLYWCLKRKGLYQRVKQSTPVVVHPNHPEYGNGMKISVAGSGVNGNAVSEGQSQGSSGPSDVHVIEVNSMVISIQVLRTVTNNFSEDNILGKGGFGTVYRGELPDGTKIAVKRMNSGVLGDKGLGEFKSEIDVLSRVRHRHLVSLLGYCLDGNEKLLVYEYLPQGALSSHLFSWKEEGLKPLEWKQRLTIGLDVARGVEYLHNLAQQSFIHRDLKPSNILLGDDMRAKVADFGLVRLAPDGGKTSIETKLAGTFGYLAPEYAVMGRITTKVDVFSFGVILMEMITGRKALDESQSEDSVHLVSWFRRMSIDRSVFQKAIDRTIELDEETLASVNTVAELAGHCCAREPSQRPDMGHAVNVLSSLTDKWKPAEENSEDMFGIDFDMSLPQALKKWQAFEVSSIADSSSSFGVSRENTQTSLPTRPTGFADSFTSADGR